MIIKGQARGRAKQLAAHLLRADQNESIELFECRGTVAEDVDGALIEMELRGKAARTERPLYHASISPEADTPLSPQQVRKAVHLLEGRLGLHGLPRLIVLHQKEGREHVHVVWCRVDPNTGTSVHMSWNYRIHEQVARELERQFGHRQIDSSFDKRRQKGSRRAVKEYERRQEERSHRATDAITAEVTALWQKKTSGEQFQGDLAKAGYRLARGDRRVFVIIDRDGNVHSLARRIEGANSSDIRRELTALSLDQLPSVADVRREIETAKPPPSKPQGFGIAAREVSRSGNKARAALRRTIRYSLTNVRTVVSPEGIATTRPARLAASGAVILSASGAKASNYRSRRAALVAHYAGKIVQALHHLSGEELDAALVTLRGERDAALEQLKFELPKQSVSRRRRRLYASKGSQPHVRFRLRIRPLPRA